MEESSMHFPTLDKCLCIPLLNLLLKQLLWRNTGRRSPSLGDVLLMPLNTPKVAHRLVERSQSGCLQRVFGHSTKADAVARQDAPNVEYLYFLVALE